MNRRRGFGQENESMAPGVPAAAPTPQYQAYLAQQRELLQNQVSNLTAAVLKKELDLMKREKEREERMASSGLKEHFSALPFYLAPGNVGDINNVIWPFWFSTPVVQVPIDSQVPTGITITQEAAFIAVMMTKTIFQRDTTGLPVGQARFEYFDPNDPAGTGETEGLRVSFRDATSTRVFVDRTFNVDHIGNPRFPTWLPAPQLFMPNVNVDVIFENAAVQEYWASISFYGLRIRIDQAQEILSNVYGD